MRPSNFTVRTIADGTVVLRLPCAWDGTMPSCSSRIPTTAHDGSTSLAGWQPGTRRQWSARQAPTTSPRGFGPARARSSCARSRSRISVDAVRHLRRIVIAEAERFPEIAHVGYERGPECTVIRLAEHLARLAARGVLRIDDAVLAGHHFNRLVLPVPLNKLTFIAGESPYTAAELQRFADEVVRVFLAAYGRQ